MSRPRKTVPAYTNHKPTGQAYVRIPDGPGRRRIIYLGAFGSPASRSAYAREIAKLGLKAEAVHAAIAEAEAVPGSERSLNEVLFAFHEHADRHYRRPDGTHTREFGEFKQAIGFIRRLFGESPAAEFGPRKLKTLREAFVAEGWCRRVVNLRINRVRHMFKWAAGEELVPGSVWQDLRSVEGLQAGRSVAPERPPVAPVAAGPVLATLPYLRPTVRAMVTLQLLTGMRPGEVVRIRPAHIDFTDDVWVYRPVYHKLSYRNRPRAIALGPQAKSVLEPFTPTDPNDFYFSPRRSVEQFHAERGAARTTPLYPSHSRRNQRARKRFPELKPNERYTSTSYGRAIARAVERANRPYIESGLEIEQHVPHWHPNQLRHAHATEVRRRFGLEAAQVAMGHARADITQVYAEKHLALAAKVASEMG